MGLEIYWKILSKRSKVEAIGEVGGRRRGGGELEGEEDGDREREREGGRGGGGVSLPLSQGSEVCHCYRRVQSLITIASSLIFDPLLLG